MRFSDLNNASKAEVLAFKPRLAPVNICKLMCEITFQITTSFTVKEKNV